MLPAFVKRGQVSNIYRSMVRQVVEKADPAKRKFADREEWKSVLAVLQEDKEGHRRSGSKDH